MFLEHKVIVFQLCRIGCVWKTPFHKSGLISFIHGLGVSGMLMYVGGQVVVCQMEEQL